MMNHFLSKKKGGLFYVNSACTGLLPLIVLLQLMDHTNIFSQTRQDIHMRSAVSLQLRDVR
jgi:hypothetical protein